MAADGCKIFVNGRPMDALNGDGVIDAIQRWDPSLAEQLKTGELTLADSRGLPAEVHSPVYGGAIFRVIGSRQPKAADDPLDGSPDNLQADA